MFRAAFLVASRFSPGDTFFFCVHFMSDIQDAYRQLCQHAIDTKKLSTVQALLEWDQQTYLPPAAGEYRAEQIAFMAGIIHQRQVDPRVGEWLDALHDSEFARDRRSASGASIFQWRRQYQRQKKLPQSLVEELARTCSLAQLAWIEARKANDFPSFAPHLSRILELKRQQADAIGFEDCRYDALLDDFEPLAKTDEIRQVLASLRAELVPLIQQILAAKTRPDDTVVRGKFPRHGQEQLGASIARAIGFDFSRGRLDATRHPFCTEMGPADCRITTRYDETYFNSSFFGILHEAGHGLYEQGLPGAEYGLASGDFCSLGIHESQSRMWENLVGRSSGFWKFAFPLARDAFPESLAGTAALQWYAAVNQVRPNLIRVEADEATYNLHIVIRFELEQALLEQKLSVADLPNAWNDAYQRDVGIRPDTDSDGVLQDIHWSAGLFGYFPTYTLGNIFAAQLFERAGADLGDLQTMFGRGDFAPLLEWLRQNVHSVGNRFSSAELMTRVTGRALDSRPLIEHLRTKLFPLYGLAP